MRPKASLCQGLILITTTTTIMHIIVVIIIHITIIMHTITATITTSPY